MKACTESNIFLVHCNSPAQGLQVICISLRKVRKEVCVCVCAYSIRQAYVTVGMVRTATVNLVWVARLFHHHRAGLHRLWSLRQKHKQKFG